MLTAAERRTEHEKNYGRSAAFLRKCEKEMNASEHTEANVYMRDINGHRYTKKQIEACVNELTKLGYSCILMDNWLNIKW